MKYELKFDKRVKKQIPNINSAKLGKKLSALLDIIEINPFQQPPEYEALIGDKKGFYSRRINHQHRLVYSVDESTHTVWVESCWSHYDY